MRKTNPVIRPLVAVALVFITSPGCLSAQQPVMELLWEHGGIDVPEHAVWMAISSGAILGDA